MGTHTLSLVFTPTDTTDFKAVTATTTVTVTQVTPTITWLPNPATFAYGTAFSGAQLDATASTAGSFVYTPAAGTTLTVGTHTLSLVFTPTDTTDFKAVTATTTVTVTQATPTITWLPNPATFVYGTALSGAQLDATASTAGSFVYTPAAGNDAHRGHPHPVARLHSYRRHRLQGRHRNHHRHRHPGHAHHHLAAQPGHLRLRDCPVRRPA